MSGLERQNADTGTVQSFAYEIRGDSAVIWRCFSRDTRVVIPPQINGLPVTELAPYAFSAHLDETELLRGLAAGRLHILWSLLEEGAKGIVSAQTQRENEQEGLPDDSVQRENEQEGLLDGSIRRVNEQEGLSDDSVQRVNEQEGLLDDSARRENERKGLSDDSVRHRNGQEGLPDAPALCGAALEELVLPDSVERVGRYCFYNCENLAVVVFSGRLKDWGSGVFTGCHRIRSLRVHAAADGVTYLKDVLDEVREELCVEYEQAGTARLMFPEFYEEGVENTPARILETHVHGSGILYRNCFRNRKIDFHQYDSLFPYAAAQESPQFLVQMAVCRLRWPYELASAAKEQYLNYLVKYPEDCAAQFVSERDMEGIRWYCGVLEREQPSSVAEHDSIWKERPSAAAEHDSIWKKQPSAAAEHDRIWKKQPSSMLAGSENREEKREEMPGYSHALPGGVYSETSFGTPVSEFLDCLTACAGQHRFTEALGYAMDYCHTHGSRPRKRRRLEL